MTILYITIYILLGIIFTYVGYKRYNIPLMFWPVLFMLMAWPMYVSYLIWQLSEYLFDYLTKE